jgi:O-antigen/teichoic acid export membrane protein
MFEKIKSLTIPPLLKNIFIYAFSDGLSKALPFLVFPIVAYYLSAEDFGRVNNYQVLILIITPFIGLSTNSYLTIEYHKKNQDIKKMYNQIIYFNFFMFLITSVITIFMLTKINKWAELDTVWIFSALFSALFLTYTELYTTKLRMEEKAKIFGLFNFSTAFISSALTILLVVVLKLNWQGRIFSLLITTILFGAIAIYNGLKFIKKFYKLDFSYWESFLFFGLPLLPHNLSIWIKTGFDKLFITDSLGLAANGVYSFALSINTIFALFSAAFFSAFSPYVYAKLAVDNSIELANAKNDIVKKIYYFLLFYLSILFIGYFVLHFLIKQFFFLKYGESLYYLPFLLGYSFFNSIYISLSMFVYYSKKTKFLGILTISTSLLQVVLMMNLLEYFGVLGAAIASFSVSIVTTIVIYIYSNRVFPMNWFQINLKKTSLL